MPSLSSIGNSGLQAAQLRLDASANTGANANTPGYRRVTVAQAAVAENAGVRATAQREQAKSSYEALRSAWLDWQGSHAAKADDRAALLQKLWEAGELSTTDTLVQLKQSLDTELVAAGVRARVWQAWADWLAASGGLAQWLDLDDRVDTVSKEVSP